MTSARLYIAITDIAIQVVFQACHDAHIALSLAKNKDTANSYEIVIGGWQDSESVIRDCKQCTHQDEVHHK